MKSLVILTGPTAVGKTAMSIELAKRINGEIISADCMQVYKYMDIGTAKIMPDEMDGVTHHLIDCIDPNEDFNVVKFKNMASFAMEQIYAKGKIPIICGGTGFYIQALLYDIQFENMDTNEALRAELELFAKENGNDALHLKLKEVDPESAAAIPANNVKRVIRAIEYFRTTGMKISTHNEIEKNRKSPYNFAYFVLNDERDVLYNRIDQRVNKMVDAGLVEEVKMLVEKGYHLGQTSMDGIGYKEIIWALEGASSLEDAIESIKQSSRHYAKRQLTWFRREKEVIWLDKSTKSESELLNDIINVLNTKGII